MPLAADRRKRKMKKIIIALLIALIIPACVFAGRGMIDLTLGVTASSSYDIDDVKEGALKEFTMDALRFGADAEVKLAFVGIDGKLFYDSANKGISGLVSANLAVDIFFVRVKAGLGYEYQYNLETKQFIYGNAMDIQDFDNFKDANFDITAGVDILLGNLTVGAYASLPTNVSITKGNWDELLSTAKEGWDQAKLGMVIGISLI